MSVGSSSGPTRTCLGCRQRAAKAELLRVVRVEAGVVPDPRAVLPGRGGYLHPTLDCLAQARRRRVWSRAFREETPGEVSAVEQWLAEFAQ